MAQAEIRETMGVSPDKFFQAIVRYEDYPKFVDGCSSVKVERPKSGKARVTYNISLFKEISYTLDHVEDAATGAVSWSLVESDFLKKNTGRWELKTSSDGKTAVYYTIDIEFKIPVPGLILNRLVKGSLPAMLKNFEKQAKKA